MNCMALEQRGEVLLVDCGVTFDDAASASTSSTPTSAPLETLGAARRGVVVTHGHEDHIGALPYLLQRHDVPVCGAAVRARARPRAPRRARGPRARAAHRDRARARAFDVGSFRIEPIRVTHSIADATALAITHRRRDASSTPATSSSTDAARRRALRRDALRASSATRASRCS